MSSLRTWFVLLAVVLGLAGTISRAQAQSENSSGSSIQTPSATASKAEAEQLRQELAAQRRTIEQLRNLVEQLVEVKSRPPSPANDGNARIIYTSYPVPAPTAAVGRIARGDPIREIGTQQIDSADVAESVRLEILARQGRVLLHCVDAFDEPGIGAGLRRRPHAGDQRVDFLDQRPLVRVAQKNTAVAFDLPQQGLFDFSSQPLVESIRDAGKAAKVWLPSSSIVEFRSSWLAGIRKPLSRVYCSPGVAELRRRWRCR